MNMHVNQHGSQCNSPCMYVCTKVEYKELLPDLILLSADFCQEPGLSRGYIYTYIYIYIYIAMMICWTLVCGKKQRIKQLVARILFSAVATSQSLDRWLFQWPVNNIYHEGAGIIHTLGDRLPSISDVAATRLSSVNGNKSGSGDWFI